MSELNRIRRALFTSMISLILCVSTLVGSTFAWFTDRAVSTNNVISSGKLAIDLEYAKNNGGSLTEWKDVAGSSDVFDSHTVWEPGQVEVVYLKISNIGDLALKYQLFVNVFAETPGQNEHGESFLLSDSLVFKVIEVYDGSVMTDDEARARISSTAMGLKEYDGASRRLSAGGVTCVAIIVYMPEAVGNSINNFGPDTPHVELGINLRATQIDQEHDSFGPDYDKNIVYGATYVENLEDLRESIDSDAEILINQNIGVTDDDHLLDIGSGGDEYLVGLVVRTDTELHLSENALGYVGTKRLDALIHVTNGARLDLVGTSQNRVHAEANLHAALITADKGSTVNIHGGDYSAHGGTILYADDGAVINVYKGLFKSEGASPLLVSTGVGGAKIYLYGGTFVNFDPRTAAGGSMVADGYEVIEKTNADGDVLYTVVPEEFETYTPAEDIQSIRDAFSASADGVYISNDIVAKPNTESLLHGKAGEPLFVNGGGSTITTNGRGTQAGVSLDYGYVSFIPALHQNCTLSDLRVVGSGYVEIGNYESYNYGTRSSGIYTVTNLVIEDLVATLHINNNGNNIAPAFSHLSKKNCYLIDCVMTGATTLKDGYKCYDAAFVNSTATTIQGGRYGSIYVGAGVSFVNITGAEIESIDNYAISKAGRLTLGAGTTVGVITMNPGTQKSGITIKAGAQVKKLVFGNDNMTYVTIEEGAIVDLIVYQGVNYTLEEWRARS